ncbi:MAG: RNA polymerase sigma factor [Bacillota bacterium]|nr:RNA polymerase sigma factor [Bacillota bacterium]MDP4160542.1 RNA polymerase sigma factor [Bacillota bacterium]
MEVSKEEFETIYRDHYHKIQSFIYNLTGNWAMTEDLTQETFVKALKEIDSVRDNSRLCVWLNRVAYNLFIDLKRKKGSYTVPIDSSDMGKLVTIDLNPHKPIEQKIMSECVHQKLLLLSETYRVPLYLDMQGYSNQEIAITLNCTLANVKIRLHRARKKIKEILDKECSFYFDERNVLCCVPIEEST